MRLLILATSALALTACTSHDMFAPHYTPNGYHQSATHHGGYAHQAVKNGQYAGNHNYNVAAPVEVYPTGHSYASHQQAYGGVPALRGSQHRSQNQSQFYGNLGAVMYDVDEDIYGAVARLGVQQGIIGAEAEGSIGLINESRNDIVFDNNNQPVNVRSTAGVNYSTGVFGVVRQPLSQRFNVLARGGYHYTELGAKARAENGPRVSTTGKTDGFAYGVGAEYYVDSISGLRFDYTRYEDRGSNASDTIAATYFQRF